MINKVILIGRLGANAEFKQSRNISTAHVPLATTEKRKNANGEWVENTEWHRVTFFNKQAEIARDYLTKGMLIYIEGKIKTSKYKDKQGIEKHSTEILADRLQMLSYDDKQENAPSTYENSKSTLKDEIPF